ncbi:reducing polyketide synthase FUB1 [Colletotrichum spaethianum]|uniref:Reducing polyketide synthase FUB1 n=1 Tax=Colletotrichum spaethianum TaxID=700344 RepID=A0AA37P8F2_9PEZI|nr:reducing polyketide synthase FUB1 [Colletotrichum spaethianum]GKT47554.1 reducing polyketide synthase FUB1 [Colletotrichum spaethianum]
MTEIDQQEPIAIIGAACRLPGEVSSLGDLWDMISHERTGHGKIPADRWDADVLHHPDQDRKGSMAVKNGYFLKEDISHFDAPFFSTTAKEAASMDPVKRLLLEVSYESIENAGIPVESLMNSQTGCYVGCMTDDYELLSLHDIYDLGHTAASAISEAMTANRVSWFFGLRGPSLTLDTACSSSLYALHLACQSLKLKETNMGLVAGVNLILNPNTMHQLSAMHMLSPEGISHTFDDRANGYGRGEGIGCLVVKRLSDALRDGDTIRAVIRHTGANADGKTPSITQPSSDAQAELIRRTYDAAGLPLSSTQYFEAHGTGTPVGDPIELRAIASTLGAARTAEGLGPLYVGSIKPSVGHTEGCSGLAGVFKAVVCLEKGMLVPTYGVERVNPKLTLDEWNLKLPPSTMKWPSSGQRRISINSFGFGGANAHAILDDAHHYLSARGLIGKHNTKVHVSSENSSESGISMGPETPMSELDSKAARQLFVFSTKDQSGIQRLSSLYSNELPSSGLDKEDTYYLSNLAYTLAVRRSHHDFRSFAVASSLAELKTQLSKGLPKMKRSSRQDNNLIFVFTGQGAQWPAMGKQLLSNPVFRQSVEKSQLFLKALGCEWDTIRELSEEENSNISLPEFSQTLCTVLQVALVDLLRYWAITPKATVGHSSGEIAAAYAASYITHGDAIKIAYVRGLSSSCVTRKGAMMAVGLSRDEAQGYLAQVPSQSVVVACINSPSSLTLSGDIDAIDSLEKIISADGKFARKLKVKTAYHSPHMLDVSQGYLERIGHVSTLSGGETIMFSSLTGKRVDPQELNAHYWVNNMCAPVEFSAALSSLLSLTAVSGSGRGKAMPVRWGGLIELGPHSALQGPVQQNIAASTSKTAKEAPYMSMILRGKDANETALTVAGKLWAMGVGVNLSSVSGDDRTSLIMGPQALTDLPPYPWNHGRSFWHEAYSTKSNRFPAAPRTDLLGVPEDLQNSLEPRWKNYLRISENPWIEDHKITGTILYPAAGMLVMALEGVLQISGAPDKIHGFRFRNVSFERGLVVASGDDAAVETRLSLQPHQTIPGQWQFTIFSTTTGTSWTKHCSGSICLEYATADNGIENSPVDPAWIQQSKTYRSLIGDKVIEEVDVDTFYDHLQTIGMEYGPLFRNVVSLTAVPTQKSSYGIVIIPDTLSAMPANFEYPHIMHPATMDAIFHLLLAAVNDGKPVDEAAVPYSIDDMFVASAQPQGAGSRFSGYGNVGSMSKDGHEIVGNLIVSDEAWSAPKLVVKGFALRKVTSADGASASTATVSAMRKCARVEWSEDIDFLKTGGDVSRLRHMPGHETGSLSLWLDRLTHKKPVVEVLVVLNNDWINFIETIRDLQARGGRCRGISKTTFVVTKASDLDMMRAVEISLDCEVKLWDVDIEEEGLLSADSTQDLILLIGSGALEVNSDAISKVQKMLSPQGYLVVVSTEESQSKIKPMLEKQGFSKTFTVSGDSHNAFLVASVHSSSGSEISKAPAEVHLLVPSLTSAEASTFASNLIATLSAAGIVVHSTTLNLENVAGLMGKHVISLLELESPLIYSWNEDQFTSFKSLVSSVAHLFWLTRGGVIESWNGGVEFAPAQGLLRVMRNEYSLSALPHLDLSSDFDPTSVYNASLVADVWRSSLANEAEMEYAEFQGAIHVPRAIEDSGFDGDLQLASGIARPVRASLAESGKPMKLASAVEEGDFLWVEDEEAEATLQPDQVEIQVEFVGLPETASSIDDAVVPQLAREAVGLVVRCGTGVKTVSAGQRVVVFGTDTCKTCVRQTESLVAPVPAELLADQAAALPSVFIAAQYSLLEIAGLGKGQSVLIHDAATALGQAAVQVSQSVGAEVFALVASKEQKAILSEQYGIPPTRIFDYNLQHFIAAIEQATDRRGLDVILSIYQHGPSVLASTAALGEFGFFVDLAGANSGAPEISLPIQKRNATLARVDMDRVQKVKPNVIQSLFQRAFSAPITPIHPTTVFSVTNTALAVDWLRTQKHGKVVLSFDDSDLIFTPPPPAKKLVLDEQGTYVLAGGLGALGLDIASMMIDHGAKHLVFLSRSGGSKNEHDLENFRNRGVNVEAYKCDVNQAESVTHVFGKLKDKGRIVKGLIQCAMVLEDSIFENMTHEKWIRAFMPKTRGSSNLLSQLSASDAPFFIMLSSITGIIGNTAQANYASGNTFEDALAHYARKHLGIAATSIDVGLVSDSSHFTSAGEFGELEDYLHMYQHGWSGLQCTLDELRIALRAVMSGATADGQEVAAQMVLGLGDSLIRNEGATGFERDRKFDHRVVQPISSAGDGIAKGLSVGEKLAKATTAGEAATAVEVSLKIQIAAAIGVEVDEVDGQKPLPEFGVDSLKAVEMRNRALREMQSDVSVFELLSATPLTDLAAKIASRSALVKLDADELA